MALEYRQIATLGQSVLREPDYQASSSPYPIRKRMNRVDMLEEEIYILRTLMEKTAEDEQSFTSEMVVYISSMLDKKINEFMILERSKKTMQANQTEEG